MRRKTFFLAAGFFLAGAVGLCLPSPQPQATPWSLDATYIEACSCHLFCPCYFNPMPEHPYCEFNMAVKVNNGKFGEVSLKGARYWLTGDLGEEFGPGKTSKWLVATFDPSVTPPQRDALVKILTQKVYPWNWAEVQMDESSITWEITGNMARAKLANGKGEMVLEQWKGNDGGKSVLQNVKYFGADSNDGFVMYKSKVHRWDGFGHKFEYSGRTGFTIRLRSSGTL
ncbi:MAG: DUF1326 domain-containing protein [Acidobacteria bacterium]|nr:DUF1326 domain-containing protein [Acidobacteriota bacterium]